VDVLGAVLQATNSTTAVTSAKPLWVTSVEVVVLVAGIAIVGTLFIRAMTGIAKRAGASRGVVHSLNQWLSVLMIVGALAGVTYLTGLSSDIATLTLTGIAGLAVTLALQDSLANIIAGVLLISDGVIRLGDDIQYGGPGGVRGEVVKLSLRRTWIRTSQGVITVIGNSNLSAGPIINFSAGTRLGKKLQV